MGTSSPPEMISMNDERDIRKMKRMSNYINHFTCTHLHSLQTKLHLQHTFNTTMTKILYQFVTKLSETGIMNMKTK
jgi:hypothetical protein